MKKIFISVLLMFAQLIQIMPVASAYGEESEVYALLMESVCSREEFVEKIDEATGDENIGDYTDFIELNENELISLHGNGEEYASLEELAEEADLQIVSGDEGGSYKLAEKFQTCRLFIKLKSPLNLSDEDIHGALSEVSSVSVSDEGMIFAGFLAEGATVRAYDMLELCSGVEFVESDSLVAFSYGGNYTWGTDACNVGGYLEAFPDLSERGEVTVAVIDSGLNAEDPIFEGRIIYDGNEGQVTDTIGHGTHVAGIIASFTEELSESVKICPYKINAEPDGTISYTTISQMYTTVEKASKHDIINMSFFIVTPPQTLLSAVNSATGSLFVIGAGNDGVNMPTGTLAESISRLINGVVVTAIDAYGIPADFSNYSTGSYRGSYIAAPGVDIRSTYGINGLKYTYMSGTSQATPHVSAAAAIIYLSLGGEPEPRQIKGQLLNNYLITPSGWNANYGKGILYFNVNVGGELGAGFTWKYDQNTLTITGEGELPHSDIPWKRQLPSVKKAVFEGNISNITSEKLGNPHNLQEIVLSESNTYYKVADGVLYSSDGTELVLSPSGLRGEYTVKDGTLKISAGAFYGRERLSSVVIPSSVTEIKENAFSGCTGLSDIYYKGTEEEWSEISKAEGWDESASYMLTCGYIDPDYSGDAGEGVVWKLWKESGLLELSGYGSTYDFELVTNGGQITGNTAGWSQHQDIITRAVVKNGIEVIGKNTFAFCGNFSDISLADTVKTIKSGAFPSNIRNITLPRDFEGFDGHVLTECSSLLNVFVHEENPYYSSTGGILYNKEGTVLICYPRGRTATEYIIPEGVKKIADYAFVGSYPLKKVVFCEGLEEIGYQSFLSVPFTTLEFPSSLKKIGYQAFAFNDSLTSVNLPEGFEELGSGAFSYCTYLKKLNLPASIKKLGSGVFERSYYLTELYYGGTEAEWNLIEKPSDWNYGLEFADVIYQLIMPDRSEDKIFRCGEDVFAYVWVEEGLLIARGTGTYEFNSELCNTYGENIRSVYLYDTVTGIGDNAFYDFVNLKSVRLHDKITSIGASAFQRCLSLESITLPKGLTQIKDNTFFVCESLKEIKLPSVLREIGSDAFKACEALEEIEIPSNVNAIRVGAFKGCISLKSITLTGKITAVEDETFNGCVALARVQLPGTVTKIGAKAFLGCSSLVNLNIPSGVTEIGAEALADCGAIEGLGVPGSLKTLGDYAFRGCDIKDVLLPASLETVGLSPFVACDIEEYKVQAGNSLFAAFDGVLYNADKTRLISYPTLKSGTEFTMPETAATADKYAFAYAKNLEKVTLNSAITELPEYIFCGAEKLREVETGKVTKVGRGAFYDCVSLTSPGNLESVTVIDHYGFYNCQALVGIGEPLGLETIGGCAFQNCVSLVSVAGENCIKTIGNDAFNGCSSFTGIGEQTGLFQLGDRAFYKCTSLTEATIGEKLTIIGKEAFGYCTGIDEVVIFFAYNRTIGDLTFNQCGIETVYYTGSEEDWEKSGFYFANATMVYNYIGSGYVGGRMNGGNSWMIHLKSGNLIITGTRDMAYLGDPKYTPWYEYRTIIKSVEIREGVTSVGAYHFAKLPELERVEIADSVKTIATYAFSECPKLTYVSPLPKSLSVIEQYAFNKCKALKEIEFTSGVEVISRYAFYQCSALTDVVLVSGTKTVEQRAFYQCSKLKNLTLPDTVETIGDYAFYYCTSLTLEKFPDELKTLGSYAFYCCSAMSSVIMNNKVESYGGKALYRGSGTLIVYYKGSPEEYESITNWNNSSVKRCYYFDGVTYPEYFGETTGDIFWQVDAETRTLKLYGEKLNSTNLSGSMTEPYAPYASYIKNIVLDDRITEIPYYAFQNLTALETVTLPPQIIKVGDGVFRGCTSLKRVDLSSTSAPRIYAATFSGCTALEEVILSPATTHITDNAFASSKKLKKLFIPVGLTLLGTAVFGSYDGLTICYEGTKEEWQAVTNSSQVPEENMIYEYVRFREGDISGTELSWVLDSNSGILEITGRGELLKKSGEEMPWYEYGSTVGAVKIGEGISSLGANVFDGCLISSIEVSDGNPCFTSENNILLSKDKTSLVMYPSGAKEDGFSLPDSVTHIADYAFSGCSSLTYLDIPATVKEIGENAFTECVSLDYIYYGGEINEWKALSAVTDAYVYFNSQKSDNISIDYVIGEVNEKGENVYYVFGKSNYLKNAAEIGVNIEGKTKDFTLYGDEDSKTNDSLSVAKSKGVFGIGFIDSRNLLDKSFTVSAYYKDAGADIRQRGKSKALNGDDYIVSELEEIKIGNQIITPEEGRYEYFIDMRVTEDELPISASAKAKTPGARIEIIDDGKGETFTIISSAGKKTSVYTVYVSLSVVSRQPSVNVHCEYSVGGKYYTCEPSYYDYETKTFFFDVEAEPDSLPQITVKETGDVVFVDMIQPESFPGRGRVFVGYKDGITEDYEVRIRKIVKETIALSDSLLQRGATLSTTGRGKYVELIALTDVFENDSSSANAVGYLLYKSQALKNIEGKASVTYAKLNFTRLEKGVPANIKVYKFCEDNVEDLISGGLWNTGIKPFTLFYGLSDKNDTYLLGETGMISDGSKSVSLELDASKLELTENGYLPLIVKKTKDSSSATTNAYIGTLELKFAVEDGTEK